MYVVHTCMCIDTHARLRSCAHLMMQARRAHISRYVHKWVDECDPHACGTCVPACNLLCCLFLSEPVSLATFVCPDLLAPNSVIVFPLPRPLLFYDLSISSEAGPSLHVSSAYGLSTPPLSPHFMLGQPGSRLNCLVGLLLARGNSQAPPTQRTSFALPRCMHICRDSKFIK